MTAVPEPPRGMTPDAWVTALRDEAEALRILRAHQLACADDTLARIEGLERIAASMTGLRMVPVLELPWSNTPES